MAGIRQKASLHVGQGHGLVSEDQLFASATLGFVYDPSARHSALNRMTKRVDTVSQ
jgi:hypothetical protein